MNVVIMEPLGISAEELAARKKPFEEKGVTFTDYPKTTDTQKLIEEAHAADAMILANMPMPSEVIRACKNLKFIDIAFTGVDHVGLDAAREQNIAVSNASGYSNEAVAELVIGMTLSVARNLRAVEDRCREGRDKTGLVGWEIKGKTVGIVGLGKIHVVHVPAYSPYAVAEHAAALLLTSVRRIHKAYIRTKDFNFSLNNLTGFDLHGKTVGVVGTGKIGRIFIGICRGFGMNVIAYDAYPAKDSDIEYVSLDELFARSDIISLHCPLTDETRGLIGEKELNKMKDSAYLINVARGPVVDEAALVQALNDGVIAGACIDVFDKEPPLDPATPLLHAKNALVTPHVAFATQQSMSLRAEIVFDNLAKWMDGNPINVVQ